MEKEHKPVHDELENQPKDSGSQKKQRNPLIMLVVGLLIALSIGIGVLYGIGVKSVKAQSQSTFTMQVAKIFNLSVAKVNGKNISYTQYVDNLNSMQHFYDQMSAEEEFTDEIPTSEQMADLVLSRLIVNKLINQVADDQNIELTNEETTIAVEEQVLSQFESKEQAAEEIKRLHGWEYDHFVQEIIVPALLERKLAETYVETQQPNEEQKTTVKAQAEEVLTRIKNGDSFEELAKEFGSDGTKEKGGDLGWFGRGVMVPEFEEAIFSLEKGQLKDELVTTQFGYHIVQVDDKRVTTDEETGLDMEEVKARHILFQLPQVGFEVFQEFMTAELKKSNIQVAAGFNNPLKDFLEQAQIETQQ